MYQKAVILPLCQTFLTLDCVLSPVSVVCNLLLLGMLPCWLACLLAGLFTGLLIRLPAASLALSALLAGCLFAGRPAEGCACWLPFCCSACCFLNDLCVGFLTSCIFGWLISPLSLSPRGKLGSECGCISVVFLSSTCLGQRGANLCSVLLGF